MRALLRGGFRFDNETLASNETIFSAVSMLSGAMASLPLTLRREAARIEGEEHRVAALLEYGPNPNMTTFQFIRCMETLRDITGAGYAVRELDPRGGARALWLMRTQYVTPLLDRESRQLYYHIRDPDTVVTAKAALYRATMDNEPLAEVHRKALVDDSASGGDKFLPKTVATGILAEPTVKNPLRQDSEITNITNLELPKISFSLDDDFIADGATAREIKAEGSNVTFGRNKFKVYVDISETVLRGTDTNLVSVVDRGMESGLAKKEKKVAFAHTPKIGEEHMSFYNKSDGASYDIIAVTGAGKLRAILNAIADLEEVYRENAKVYMPFSYYTDMLLELANNSATLYSRQPEEIIGKPVRFCDYATIPVVGDFSFSHFNYDGGMLYERDKNIKTGMESFVLTAWFDHQIKMKAAFRLAVEEPATP